MEIWSFAVPFAAGLTAVVRHSDLLARTRPRARGFEPGLQSLAALHLMPLTAGVYLSKRALPQIASDEADERERSVQGDVCRRTHAIIIGLAIGGTLVVLDPDAGNRLRAEALGHGFGWVDVLLPVWVLLFLRQSESAARSSGRRPMVSRSNGVRKMSTGCSKPTSR